jgi:hypothetical protein
MSWWRKVLRIGTVLVPEVTKDKRIRATTTIISSALTNNSPEDAAATLLMAAIEKGSEKPEIRAVALKIHDVINHIYSDDPDFH